jgi:integrase
MGTAWQWAAPFLSGNNNFSYLSKMTKTHSESGYVPTYLPGIDVCTETTIEELKKAFLKDAKIRYDHRDYNHYEVALKLVCQIHSNTKTSEFGTKALIDVQEHFVQQGYSRQYCNKLVNFIRSVFKWGSLRELVPKSTPYFLKLVIPLSEGKTTTPETEPRLDVPDEVVEATLPHLLPTVAAMVQVQRAAVMRPSEVCRMKVGDIDTKDEIWVYEPKQHKGKWRGHPRTVALGKLEQEIIAPRLIGKQPDNAVFSPKDAISERYRIMKRKTKRTPSQEKRHQQAVENNRSRVREHYDSNSYSKSIKQSIKKANRTLTEPIPLWTPYQLRHAGVTEITETDGLDVARAVAGQKTLDVAQIYNHADKKIAIKNAQKRSTKNTKKIPPKPSEPAVSVTKKRRYKKTPQKPPEPVLSDSPMVCNAFFGTAEEFYQYELNRARTAEIALQTSSGSILTLYQEERRNG